MGLFYLLKMVKMDAKLNSAISDFVSGMDYHLWGIRWYQQGKSRHLQVFIDHENGIEVDDCARVSRSLSVWLDVEGPELDHYILEVSSPGTDRLLLNASHFQLYKGEKAAFRLHRAVAGRKNMTAVIVDSDSEQVTVGCDGEEYSVPQRDIKDARLQPVMLMTSKKQNKG